MFVTQWHKKSGGKDTTFPFRMADPKVSCKVPARPVGKEEICLIENSKNMKNNNNFNEIIKDLALSKTEKETIVGGTQNQSQCFCKNTCVTSTWDNACTACIGCVSKAFDKGDFISL